MEYLGLAPEEWISLGISVGVVLLVAIFGRWLVNLILKQGVTRLTRRTKTELDDTVIEAVRPPLYYFILILVAQAMFYRLDFVPEDWISTAADVFFVLFFLAGFVLVVRLVSRLFDWYMAEIAQRHENPELARGMVGFFDTVTLIVIGVIGFIVLLGHFEVNITGLVTTLGVGSLAVALAAKAAFDDTISGFIIMIDQPYRVGDRVELLDLDTWGDVVDIGLRSTRIRTRDNRMVIVPNATMGNSLIVNHAYPNNHYRIQVHVGVAYGTDIEHARETMVNAARTVEGVLEDQPVEALFLEFGDSALVFRVRWWIDSYVDTRRMFDKVNTAIYKALNEAGIEIPFPQRDVWHRVSEGEAERIAGVLNGGNGRGR